MPWFTKKKTEETLKTYKPLIPIKEDISKYSLKVKYLVPKKQCVGEGRSKLLDHNSRLFKFIIFVKYVLLVNGFKHIDRMGLHTEVLNDRYTGDKSNFTKRIFQLENKQIIINDPKYYKTTEDGAIILKLDDTVFGYSTDVGYKNPHITIAFFGVFIKDTATGKFVIDYKKSQENVKAPFEFLMKNLHEIVQEFLEIEPNIDKLTKIKSISDCEDAPKFNPQK